MSDNEVKTITERLDRIERLTLLGVKKVLTMDEAAILTGYSKGFLYQLTSKRGIPFYKKANKIYFKKGELEEWMLDTRVRTQKETDRKARKYCAENRK